jgi:acyl transferase domain-containing protein
MFENDPYYESIAIIGMSCRFPGAATIDEYWRNLREGVESITHFSDEELIASGSDPLLLDNPNFVKVGHILKDIESFDASFFGYSSQEAELIDPQQRLLLECAYEALEDGGCISQRLEKRVGVFAGMRYSGYSERLKPLTKKLGTSKGFEALLGVSLDQTAMRISYTLNLRGPSVSVQTACSTSLVAAHLACESLRAGECDVALAGAASIFIPQNLGYLFEKGMPTSPDGKCRAFDVNANGSGVGAGLGAVVLKRLSEALADRDQIYAVIRGSAVNNDGSSKVGFRSPSVAGEMEIIAEAIHMAGISPEAISFVEANGTGTFLGDSIELDALTRFFRDQTDKKGFCGIGSVKTNLGHLAHAAGMAGLIKTALCLKNGHLVPSLNFEEPNPKLIDGPFYVNTKHSPWETDAFPRSAIVNSFAIGGTNACMVLEEPPTSPLKNEKKNRPGFHILTLSAKNANVLRNLAEKYENFIKGHDETSLADICFTANSGREHFPCRFAAVADSTGQLREQIRSVTEGKIPFPEKNSSTESESAPRTAFIFADERRRYKGMGKQLYNVNSVFREKLDLCAELLKKHFELPLLPLIFEETDDPLTINSNTCAQSAVFATEYALAETWLSWGIKPFALMGCGIGEYAAACVAGVFSLEDALSLVTAHGRLDKGTPPEDESAEAFKRIASRIRYSEPSIPLLASGCNDIPERGRACNAEYWCKQLQTPDWFISGIKVLHKQECKLFLEIGPGSDLADMAKNAFSEQGTEWFPSFDKFPDDRRRILESLAELYIRGWNVNWPTFYQDYKANRISLPSYPFHRERCWFETEKKEQV